MNWDQLLSALEPLGWRRMAGGAPGLIRLLTLDGEPRAQVIDIDGPGRVRVFGGGLSFRWPLTFAEALEHVMKHERRAA